MRIYVTWQGTNVKPPDDDTEMSKHVAVYIIYRYTFVMYNCALAIVIKIINIIIPIFVLIIHVPILTF